MGTCQMLDGKTHSFIYQNGAYTVNPDPPNAQPDDTSANGVNDAGQIVGYLFSREYNYKAFIFENGDYNVLDVNGSRNVRGQAINANGQIVGEADGHGFEGHSGSFRILPDPPIKTSYSFGSPAFTGINASGQIAGTFWDTALHGFLYSDGVFRTIDEPNALGIIANSTTVNGINDAGQLVGYYTDLRGYAHGFLATPTGTVVDGESLRIDIDEPGAQSGPLHDLANLTGWAIDNREIISQVDVTVDGVLQNQATYGVSRPDVCAAYQDSASCPNVGWNLNLNTRNFSDGEHRLQVTATSSSGYRSTAGVPFAVSNADSGNPLRLTIDSPNSSSTALSGSATVYGWALDDASTIQQIDFFIDGAPVSTTVPAVPVYYATLAQYRLSRPDVCAVYSGRADCPGVGWRYMVDTTQFGNGSHTLTVNAKSANGHSATANTTFQIMNDPYTASNGPTKIVWDGPNPDKGALSGAVTFYGWAIDDEALINPQNVSYAVDGIWFGSGAYGVRRGDVCAAVVDHLNCPNVGWSFLLDTTKYANGRHSVAVRAFPNRGSGIVYITKIFEFANDIRNTSTKVYIDQPTGISPVEGYITASGWALDENTAISKVSYAIDELPRGVYPFPFFGISYGKSRPDVCAAFPGRPQCPNVGWTLPINTFLLPNGVHTLTVTAFPATGTPASRSISFTVNNSSAGHSFHSYIDSPASSTIPLSGTIAISGWSLKDVGYDNWGDYNPLQLISSVQIFVDGISYGTTAIGQYRPDVCATYPNGAGCPRVGWSMPLDTTRLANGTHKLDVKSFSGSDLQADFDLVSTSFIVANDASLSPIKLYIDGPTPDMGGLSGTQQLWGWAIAEGSPVSDVAIAIDGVPFGSAAYGISRDEVCAAYPNSAGCPNVGWSSLVDTRLLTNGGHTFEITATTQSGQHLTATAPFSVQNQP